MLHPDADLSGRVLDDYKLLRRLGQGGMGQVYLAEQFSLRRQVALKIVRPELTDAATAATLLARFRAEAEAVAKATHANIVQIYAIGRSDELSYMALEYVEGRNLREFVELKKPIAAGVGLKVMAQVAAALERAGELNMVHRDIKPENILITRQGEVKVADFGLSRCFDRPMNLTRSGVVMGTPLYMSPEQVDQSSPADHRSDLYAFGATSYFMFAGEPPFTGDDAVSVAFKHVHQEPLPLAELRPDLPVELCALIHKLMAKKPEARYQTAREVLRDIEALRANRLATTSLSQPSLSDIRIRVQNAWPSLRYWVAGASIVGALLLGLAIGWHQQPGPVVAAPGADVVDDGVGPAVQFQRQREQDLYKRFKENYKEHGPLDQQARTGLHAAVDLGLQYLDERPLDKAEAFFRGLCKPSERKSPGWLLSQLGSAMVAAFSDDWLKSYGQFEQIYVEIQRLETAAHSPQKGPGKTDEPTRDEIEAYKLLWKQDPPAAALREMIARALNHNHENSPRQYPQKLEAWRTPPRPTLRNAP
jgi:serine/threonine-protein kinase